MTQKNLKLVDMIDTLENAATGPTLTIGDILEALNSRGFGPLLLMPALITFLPTGAIPGVPLLCAIFIALVAGQILMGKHQMQLPAFMRNLAISREKIRSALARCKPILKKIDKLIHQRLPGIFTPVTEKLIALACIILGFLIIPMAIVPFAIMLPSAAIIMLALGLSARDGLLVLIGAGFIALTLLLLSVLVLS